ncbi:WGxxGxxG family protein [Paenibacillus xanthanilyticus]|uniref:WGxxGxxG family protein n=1 Tax=Paenibacillus xanthanilyticus TaxID=1783531 RepID=A0ABV8K736_9BACL
MRTRLRMASFALVIPLLLQFTAWAGSPAYATVINATNATNGASYRLPSDSSNGVGFGSTEQLGFSGSTPGYIVEQGTRSGIRPFSTPAGNGNRPLAPEQRGLSGSTPGYIMNQRALQPDGIRPLGTTTLGGDQANDFDWGWLGLLGLLGLAGARRRTSD